MASKFLDHLYHISGHLALGVLPPCSIIGVASIVVALNLWRIAEAMATQIWDDDASWTRELLDEKRSDLVPYEARLRMAVEEEEGMLGHLGRVMDEGMDRQVEGGVVRWWRDFDVAAPEAGINDWLVGFVVG